MLKCVSWTWQKRYKAAKTLPANNSAYMKKQLFLFILILISNSSFSQTGITTVPIDNSCKPYELIGELGEKLGSTFTVKGIIVEGSSKGYGGGPNLLIQVIDERSNQLPVQIPISPYFGRFGSGALPKIESDSTYSLRVYETGEFVGVPADAYKEAGIDLQTTGFYFRNRLVVISGEKIRPIESSPFNFLGQNALLSGIAKNEHDTAIIVNANWKLRLSGCVKWKKSEIGKLAEVYGQIQKTSSQNTYDVKSCQQRLVNLEDQVGKTVTLRGRAISMNGEWWFNYRGTDISVEKMKELPNWSANNHFQPIEISGTLEKSDGNDGHHTEYIVRHASWTPLKKLLIPELGLQK